MANPFATKRCSPSAIPLRRSRALARAGKLARTCLVLALTIGLVWTTAAGAAGPGSGGARAHDVQGKIARAKLVEDGQAALGSSYGGAWFDPAAAQLHLGVTSPSGRRTAERLIEQAGLGAHATASTVRSSAAELVAAQQQWNRRLKNLFARNQVTTALLPQRNAVSIRLSSSVPPSERLAVERAAAAAPVTTLVTVAPGANLGVTPLAKTTCKEWATLKGYCDPSITSGVSILIGKKPECSAGPLAINGKKERVVLTAGHCIGKAGEQWSAINVAEAESVIGPVEEFVFGVAGAKSGDFGDILIEPAWQTGKPNNPVFAVTAEWKQMNKKAEKTSYPVKGKRIPVVGNESCHTGQTSGESCGEITADNLSVSIGGKAVEGFIEVKEPAKPKEQLIAEGGDSGGPWMFVEANNEALMEGIMHGVFTTPECVEVAAELEGRQFFKTKAECENLANAEKATNKGKWQRKLVLVFYPLVKTLEKSPEGALEQLKLELLTTANEVIPGAFPELLPGAAGEKFTGKSTGGTLEVPGEGQITCKEATLTGEIVGATKKESSATITSKGCSAFGFIGARSLGEAEGKIVAKVKLKLCYINEAKKEVGVLTKIASPIHIEAVGKLLVVEGDQVGKITPINAKAKEYKLTYEQKEGKPKPEGCQGEKEHFTVAINEGVAKEAAEATTETLTFEKEQTLDA